MALIRDLRQAVTRLEDEAAAAELARGHWKMRAESWQERAEFWEERAEFWEGEAIWEAGQEDYIAAKAEAEEWAEAWEEAQKEVAKVVLDRDNWEQVYQCIQRNRVDALREHFSLPNVFDQ